MGKIKELMCRRVSPSNLSNVTAHKLWRRDEDEKCAREKRKSKERISWMLLYKHDRRRKCVDSIFFERKSFRAHKDTERDEVLRKRRSSRWVFSGAKEKNNLEKSSAQNDTQTPTRVWERQSSATQYSDDETLRLSNTAEITEFSLLLRAFGFADRTIRIHRTLGKENFCFYFSHIFFFFSVCCIFLTAFSVQLVNSSLTHDVPCSVAL